ncbi:hypothetical protein MTsPCn9_28090 [Croceitalea sp. MTPC9]|uniref:hypothetical protein n=1 Tax=unclassified Croceitalea TaxID=2632280 RepID=UPI002B3F6B2D|nr:hypothetical protein MTsPCn6_22090 [Croceitalea sp. MTPC6]GMN17871.1 hypothetical protein MTsPCn9_28090 [Croceitalea sp. MTPC9]
MKHISRVICGIVLLTVPTIEFGGYFLLNVISGNEEGLALTSFQEAMFRAGHAHAGVLVILALVAIILSNYANLNDKLLWIVRIGFPLSSILISGGFFAAATGNQLTQPNELILILYIGIVILTISLILLGVGLLKKLPSNKI